MCDIFPTEILQEIFKYACTDDGTTGRSLSLVSRRFQESSRRSKLQYLALVGAHQIYGFAEHLAVLPLNARDVRHLYISLVFELSSRTRTGKCQYVTLNEGDSSFWEHEAKISASFMFILQHISSSLVTLNLISNLRRTSILPPCHLPALQSLIIHGPMRVSSRMKTSLPMFPSLRHLSLRCFQKYPTITLQQISQQARSLRTLSFFLDRPLPDLSRDLSRVLDCASREVAFPSSLTQVHVCHFIGSLVDQNMWLRNAQKEMLKELSGIIKKDGRLVVVGMGHLLDHQEARIQWLEGRCFDY